MTNFRPPTRRESNRAERRAAIVATARQTFLETGYAATTMSLIAEAIGGSKATLWAYFESKDQLFAAVVDELTESFQAELEDALIPGRDLEHTLIDFCDCMLTKFMASQSSGLYRLIVGECDRFPEIGHLFYERGPRRLIDNLASYLELEIGNGSMRQCDTKVAAMQLVSLCQGFAIQEMLVPGMHATIEARHQYLQLSVDMFKRSYAKIANDDYRSTNEASASS